MSDQELLDAEDTKEVEETQETETTQLATADPDHVDPDDCGNFELSLKVERKELRQLGNFIRKARTEVLACQDEVERMALQSSFIQTLRTAVQGPILDALMQLQNTKLGFKTDNQGDKKKPYERDVVADVAIEAFSKGLRMVGNEVNIISGQLYATKEGFKRLLDELEGFSNLELTIGIAEVVVCGRYKNGNEKHHARIPASATWIFHGKPDSLVCEQTEKGDFRIALKWYPTDSDDLLHGKAESKLYRRIYAIVTGQEIGIDPDDDADVVEGTAETTSRVPVNNPEPPTAEERQAAFKALDSQVEKGLVANLAKCKEVSEVKAVAQKACSFLSENAGILENEELQLIEAETINRLCEAKVEDMKSKRGERSNGK